ncbi:unnamed protein product, partial [Rotaria sp. Silwood1]
SNEQPSNCKPPILIDTFFPCLTSPDQDVLNSKVSIGCLVSRAVCCLNAFKNVSIKIGGLQLEGCSFDNGRLSESAPDSPSVTAFPSCYIAWIPQDAGQQETRETISLPVYFNATRDKIVTRLNVPCSSDKDKWLQCGAALFLKNI